MKKHDKKSGKTITFMGLDHGKAVGKGTALHLGPVSGKGKGKGKGGAKTSGHVDPYGPKHDAKGHEKGSRGPFTSAKKGHAKSK